MSWRDERILMRIRLVRGCPVDVGAQPVARQAAKKSKRHFMMMLTATAVCGVSTCCWRVCQRRRARSQHSGANLISVHVAPELYGHDAVAAPRGGAKTRPPGQVRRGLSKQLRMACIECLI